MTQIAKQIVASNQAHMRMLKDFSVHAFADIEKIVKLNLSTSKAMLTESFEHSQSVLSSKDPQSLLALNVSLSQLMAEKSTVYCKELYATSADIGSELRKVVDANIAETHATFAEWIDNLTKSAPTGSEAALNAFKSVLIASQNAVESAQSQAKKVVEAAQSNFTAVANQAVDASKKAAKTA